MSIGWLGVGPPRGPTKPSSESRSGFALRRFATACQRSFSSDDQLRGLRVQRGRDGNGVRG
eukprot:697462-Pyramimonas_sp.AAC.1